MVFMLTIAINIGEHVCSTGIVKHNYMYMLMHNFKYCSIDPKII